MATDDLKAFREIVAEAAAEQSRPPTPEEGVKTVLPVIAHIDDHQSRVVWRVVSRIRADAPEVYDRFFGEQVIYGLIVDIAVEQGDDLDFDRLISELERMADERSHWLVAVPLANILPTSPYLELDERAGLGMTLQAQEWEPTSEAPVTPGTIFKHLRDRISAGVRWKPERFRLGPMDTRRTAILYLVEDGTQNLAVHVARSRAHLILALWCLFRPPESHELWPSLSEWEPQPYLYNAIDHKLYEPEVWIGGERVHGRSTTEYAEYSLSADDPAPSMAVTVTRLAADCLSARAVASAAWSLHVAEREPGGIELTDKVLHLQAAVDALCDIGATDGQGARRWARLAEKYGIWRSLRNVYQQDEIEDAKELVADVRNIAAHGSDDVLVNLGYPADRTRMLPGGKQRAGEELALARIAAAEPVLRQAVRDATRRVASEAIDHGWDDNWFASLLAAP